jgi:adenosylhomocysteine nucleosidase
MSKVEPMLMLVFALPEEARVVRRRIQTNKSDAGVLQGVFAGQEVSVNFVGVGAVRIADLERSVELIKPRMIISSGFAGATRALLEAGDFVLSTNYTDADIAKALAQQKIFDAAGPFVQVRQVASASDKWSLKCSQGALAVDMESEAIADLCRRKGLSLVTARMISDAIDENIPAIFSTRRFSGLKDLGEAAAFAARMLHLTGKLADRLETLVEHCREAANPR